jgi:hypothetical protein
MKLIKLLFSISLLILTGKNINAQNRYLDSSTYYIYGNEPSLSQGLNFATYSKESIFLDSINLHGEYYKVLHTLKNFNPLYHVYYLKVNGDTVFFNGTLHNVDGDSFKVDNLIIYNFSLNTGDTFKIKHSASGLNIELLIDSIKYLQNQDNQLRKTQYYTILIGRNNEYWSVPSPFFAWQGLGSNYGLLPFQLIKRNLQFEQVLISVCNKEKEAVYSANEFFDHWNIKDYCDESEIIDFINTISIISIGKNNIQNMVVFPNPTNDILQLKGISSGNILIYNSLGQLIIDTPFVDQINVSKLPKGMYHIFIYQDNKVFRGKFIKNE